MKLQNETLKTLFRIFDHVQIIDENNIRLYFVLGTIWQEINVYRFNSSDMKKLRFLLYYIYKEIHHSLNIERINHINKVLNETPFICHNQNDKVKINLILKKNTVLNRYEILFHISRMNQTDTRWVYRRSINCLLELKKLICCLNEQTLIENKEYFNAYSYYFDV